MTPGARVAAAIEVLDQINAGAAAEQALTAWARGSRFAGSKDRAAIRDHVFDVLRARRSLGDGDGRSLMAQLAQREQWDLSALFSGEGHSPAPLSNEDFTQAASPLAVSRAAACDIPDWLWPEWEGSLGVQAEEIALVQQGRAPVFLRVNTRRATSALAIAALAEDDVVAQNHPNVATALRVISNPRRVKNTRAFLDGLVELQDASSQFAINTVPVPKGARLLDYCAGGGGKALGFADVTDALIFAHDVAAARMRDIPVRAARAGVQVQTLSSPELAANPEFDVVFCDAPCSGSGTWRRAPDAKWRLTPERLLELQGLQDAVLREASRLVTTGGLLAYATCSVLRSENAQTVDRFVAAQPDWRVSQSHQLLPSTQGDGFFLSLLRRNT